jgi:hypothetical protein
VGRRAIDLFDDAPWSADFAIDQPARPSPRPWLFASVVSVSLLLASMALPWFTSSETPSWTPFSRWLALGWTPGTQRWGFLDLALGCVSLLTLMVALFRPFRPYMLPSMTLAICLLVVTLLEATATLIVDPGPPIHADYGAVVGSVASVFASITVAVATYLA